jgi:hypothetical protein
LAVVPVETTAVPIVHGAATREALAPPAPNPLNVIRPPIPTPRVPPAVSGIGMNEMHSMKTTHSLISPRSGSVFCVRGAPVAPPEMGASRPLPSVAFQLTALSGRKEVVGTVKPVPEIPPASPSVVR